MNPQKNHVGGWDYVVAALNMKTSNPGRTKHAKKKKAVRKPDGNIRPSTKFLLVILINHRNHKTGRCNPSYNTLMRETGYSKRTITFELQALKELGLTDWKRGYRNDYAKRSNSYTFDLPAIQALKEGAVDEENDTDEGASDSIAMEVDANEGASDAIGYGSGCGMKVHRVLPNRQENRQLEPPMLEPSEASLGNTGKTGKTNPEAEAKGHRQTGAVESDAIGMESDAIGVPALAYDDHDRRWYAHMGVGRALTGEEVTEMQRRNNLRLTPEAVTV